MPRRTPSRWTPRTSGFLGRTHKSYATQTTSLVVPDPLAGSRADLLLARHGDEGHRRRLRLPSAPAELPVKPLDPVAHRQPATTSPTTTSRTSCSTGTRSPARSTTSSESPRTPTSTPGRRRDQVQDLRHPLLAEGDLQQQPVLLAGPGGRPSRQADLAGPTINNNFNRVWPDTSAAGLSGRRRRSSRHGRRTSSGRPCSTPRSTSCEVGTDINFSPSTYDTCLIAGTTYTPFAFPVNEVTGSSGPRSEEDCNPVPGGITYWRVRPLDRPQSGSPAWVVGNFSSDFSEPQSFIYDPAGLLDAQSRQRCDRRHPDAAVVPRSGPPRRYEVTIKDKFGTAVKSNVETSLHVVHRGGDGTLSTLPRVPYTWFLTAIERERRPRLGDLPTHLQRHGKHPDDRRHRLSHPQRAVDRSRHPSRAQPDVGVVPGCRQLPVVRRASRHEHRLHPGEPGRAGEEAALPGSDRHVDLVPQPGLLRLVRAGVRRRRRHPRTRTDGDASRSPSSRRSRDSASRSTASALTPTWPARRASAGLRTSARTPPARRSSTGSRSKAPRPTSCTCPRTRTSPTWWRPATALAATSNTRWAPTLERPAIRSSGEPGRWCVLLARQAVQV